MTNRQKKIIDVLKTGGPAKPIEIAERLGLCTDDWAKSRHRRAISIGLKKLIEMKLVEKHGWDSKYQVK